MDGLIGNPPRTRSIGSCETEADFAALCAGASLFKIIVRLCLLTGLRRGEAAMLRWDWIDLEGKMISLPGSVTKNSARIPCLSATSLWPHWN